MPINWALIFSDSVEGRTRYYQYRMKRNRQRVSILYQGHQKYLAAQITRHKSKSKSVNVVFRCTNTLNFHFKCCRPADKVFLLIINLIFPRNKSCLNRNITSQFQHLFVFPMTEYDQKILNLCIKMGTRRNSRSFNNTEQHLLSERWRNVHCKCTISK